MDYSADATGPRRPYSRADEVEWRRFFAAVHQSAFRTKRTYRASAVCPLGAKRTWHRDLLQARKVWRMIVAKIPCSVKAIP
jgi:hypothetical protein